MDGLKDEAGDTARCAESETKSHDQRKTLAHLLNGVRIKRERPEFPGAELDAEVGGNPSKIRIKEEAKDDHPSFQPPPSTASGSSYFHSNGNGPDWLFPQRSADQNPSTSSSLDTLQRMMHRFDSTPLQNLQSARPSHPAADHFGSPERHRHPYNHPNHPPVPWMDRTLSPYSYPYFSVGLTPQSSSSTDSPKPNSVQCPKEFPCKKCSFVANSKKELDGHLKEEHYKVSCPNCNYIATSHGRMTRHMEFAHGAREPETSNAQSGEASPNSSGEGGADHIALMGSKTLKKPKKCKVCKSVFLTKNDYYDHMSEHFTSLLKCRVPHCKFATTLPHHMRYHTAIHTGDKSFKCPECNYKCATPSMLKSHMKCHDTVCRYRCATCSFAAKHANALNSHLKRTGHVAGPVLGTDGSIPTDDPSSKFENHVRKKPSKSSASASASEMAIGTASSSDAKPDAQVHYPLPPKMEPLALGQPPLVVETSPLGPLGRPPVNLLLPPPPPVFSPRRYQMAQMYMHGLRYGMMPQSFNFGLPLPGWSPGAAGVSPARCFLCGDEFAGKQALMQHIMSGACQDPSAPRVDPSASFLLPPGNPLPPPPPLLPPLSSSSSTHASSSSSSVAKPTTPTIVKTERNDDVQDCMPLDLSLKTHDDTRHETPDRGIEPAFDCNSHNDNSCTGSNIGVNTSNISNSNNNSSIGINSNNNGNNRKSRRKGIAYKLDLSAMRSDEKCDSRNIPILTREGGREEGRERGGEEEDKEVPASLPRLERADANGSKSSSSSSHSKLPELEPISIPMAMDAIAGDPSQLGYPCRHCQIVFKDKKMFSSHVQLHSFDDPFRCSDCRRSFLTGREFFLHLSEYEHKLLPSQ